MRVTIPSRRAKYVAVRAALTATGVASSTGSTKTPDASGSVTVAQLFAFFIIGLIFGIAFFA
jgi:hypothetical protein